MAVIGVLILYAGALIFADGIRIKECSNSRWLEIREDNNRSTPITCDEFSANETIIWILSVNRAVTGNYTCGPGSQQCDTTDSDVTIRRTDQGTEGSSVLAVVGNHRTKAGKGVVTCRLAGQIASCNTNVVSPAIISSCRLTINAEDWTASASCQYDRVYSSNGTYTCTWYRQQTGQFTRYRLLNVNVSTVHPTTGGKQYYQGYCCLPSPGLPIPEGRYIYTVDFFPGPKRCPAGSVTIKKPGDPQSSCPHYVYEGQAVQCSCLANSSAPGSPAAVVQWQGRLPGEALDIGHVSRNHTGRQFSCQLTWGLPNKRPWKTTNYILKVAYGPDDVMIKEDEGAQSTPPSSTLTLQCRAINVFPSATFTWSGVTCSSTTSHTTTSTCTFSWTPGDDDRVVTCTVRNSQFPQRFYSQTNETLSFQHPTTPPSVITSSAAGSPTSAHAENSAAPGGDEGFPLGLVIGVVIGAVVLAIIVIIIVVFIVKRKRRKTSKHLDNESCKEFEEHTNPVYGTEEEAERSPTSNTKPSAVALRISAGSSVPPPAPVPAANPSSAAPVGHSSRAVSSDSPYSSVDEDGIVPARKGLEADEGLGDYAVVGDPDLQPPGTALSGPAAVEEDTDAYAVIPTTGSKSPSTSTDAPQGYTYSVVNKPKAQATSSPPSNTAQPSDDAPQGYTYSVVNKPKAQATSSPPSNTAQPSDDALTEDENAYSVVDLNPTSPSPSSPDTECSNNVYAQVNKSAKRGHKLPSDQPNTEAVRKPQPSAKPGTKPKPDVKPKPKPSGNAAEGQRLEDEQHGDQPTSPDYQTVEPSQQAVDPPKNVTQNAPNDDYSTLNSVLPRTQQPEVGGPEDPTYSHFSDFR